jgi:hypothetical protein
MAPRPYPTWNPQPPPPFNGFPGLLYRPAFEQIGRLFADEAVIRPRLERLQADTAGQSVDGFGAWLARQEQAHGFSPDIKTIAAGDRLVKASLFWTWLFARRPLSDLGAGADHGAWTHRVQWVLVCGLAREQPLSGLMPDTVGALYAALGMGGARRLRADRADAAGNPLQPINTGNSNPFESVWDAVFDGFSSGNATQPEYLNGYIARYLPGLYARMLG